MKGLEVRREVVGDRGEVGESIGGGGEERREKQTDIPIIVKPTSTTITPNFRQNSFFTVRRSHTQAPVCDLPLLFVSPPPPLLYFASRTTSTATPVIFLTHPRCLFLLYLSAIKALQFGHSLNLPRWRFCLLLLVLACWLFGVVCRFVDIDGGRHC